MRTQVNRALGLLRAEGRPYRVGGIFWMQGGSDGARKEFAAMYADNLALLMARMRTDFGDTATPLVIGRIPAVPNSPQREVVRAVHVKLGSTLPRAAWVDTDDLPCDTDGVHLIAPGIITLGERMAEAWLKIEEHAAKHQAGPR
jgi:hypothetical protein